MKLSETLRENSEIIPKKLCRPNLPLQEILYIYTKNKICAYLLLGILFLDGPDNSSPFCHTISMIKVTESWTLFTHKTEYMHIFC